MWLAFALVEEETGNDKIAVMHHALYSAMDTLAFVDKLLGLKLLGIAQGKVGQADQGIATMDEALALANKSKKSRHAGKLYLAKGQLF